MSILFDPVNTTWTCFCGERQPDADDMPVRCPKCGGVWCRQIHLTSWQRMKDRIRRRFERTRTFESADDLIAWLEERDAPPTGRAVVSPPGDAVNSPPKMRGARRLPGAS